MWPKTANIGFKKGHSMPYRTNTVPLCPCQQMWMGAMHLMCNGKVWYTNLADVDGDDAFDPVLAHIPRAALVDALPL